MIPWFSDISVLSGFSLSMQGEDFFFVRLKNPIPQTCKAIVTDMSLTIYGTFFYDPIALRCGLGQIREREVAEAGETTASGRRAVIPFFERPVSTRHISTFVEAHDMNGENAEGIGRQFAMSPPAVIPCGGNTVVAYLYKTAGSTVNYADAVIGRVTGYLIDYGEMISPQLIRELSYAA